MTPSTTTLTTTTTLQRHMLPSSSSKRKAAPSSEQNPFDSVAKKPKKEPNGAPVKRKLPNGEEQPGGLVIVRAPPSRPPSSQSTKAPPPSSKPHASTTSRADSSTSSNTAPHPPPQPVPSTSKHPPAPTHPHPSKRFKSSTPNPTRPPGTTAATGKTRERDIHTTSRPDTEVDDDVRRMESETDDLRRQSQSRKSTMRVEMEYTQPLQPRETPQIDRNRAMRDGTLNNSGTPGTPGQRRRSSLSGRGKRASTSFENNGVISKPHSSVDHTSFYKHIDADVPDSDRARQLLIWSASRVADQPSIPHSAKRSGKDPPPPVLPKLSDAALQAKKIIQENFIRQLAEREINTNVYSPPGAPAWDTVGENEQNVKNRAREIKFTADINRDNAEDAAWEEVTRFYNSHQATVLADIEKSAQARKAAAAASAKAKGKRRADDPLVQNFAYDPDDPRFQPREAELPSSFKGIELARTVLASTTAEDPLKAKMERVSLFADRQQALMNTSLRTDAVACTDLDRRFALLSLTLHARTDPQSQPHPQTSHLPHQPILSSLMPSTSSSLSSSSRAPKKMDQREIFKALSRVDMSRPPQQIGDAARRAAKEAQRARASAIGIGGGGGGGNGTGGDGRESAQERRLTGVAPATPRKVPGTPSRKR